MRLSPCPFSPLVDKGCFVVITCSSWGQGSAMSVLRLTPTRCWIATYQGLVFKFSHVQQRKPDCPSRDEHDNLQKRKRIPRKVLWLSLSTPIRPSGSGRRDECVSACLDVPVPHRTREIHPRFCVVRCFPSMVPRNYICSCFAIHVLYGCHTERRLRPCRCLFLGAQMTSFSARNFRKR
jgi:hypothetical protein